VLLALNAMARPYAGITHDARLYSAQVLHQIDPQSFGDDLFFRYGSQDQFSIFSRVAAPLVQAIGLESAFFLLYLVFNSLLILACKRLVETLIEDRLVSTLALVYMVVAPLNFGGLDTLHVQESFVTSRLMANAFVLFGMERTIRQRYVAAFLLLALAMAFHPLMAVGGLFIWAGCLAWNFLPGKVLLMATTLLGIAGIGFLANTALATRVFGTMDESWREVILKASPFNFVSEWKITDWVNVGMGLIGVGAASYTFWKSNNPLGRFFAVATIVSIAAVVGTALAESLPYALLLQGQPYRALWILKVLQIPFAFWFASRLWSMPEWYGPMGAAVLIGVLGLTTDMPLEGFFPLFFLPIFMLAKRGLDPVPRRADWWRQSLGMSLVLGAMCWAVYKLVLLVANGAALLQRYDMLEYGGLLATNVGPIPWLALFALSLVWLARRTDFARSFQGTALALMLLVQGSLAVLWAAPLVRENCTCHGRDIRFVQDFLRKNNAPATPTIYSCLGRLDLVWLDLHAKCYFDWWQMGGVMFQRQMALEGQRRALVVGPFELDRFREAGDVSEITRMQASRFFNLDFDTGQPDLKNLRQLCQEDGIDFLLLTQEFPGLVAAGNGRVFLYDCRQVLAALNAQQAVVATTTLKSEAGVLDAPLTDIHSISSKEISP
jgi:hypothetical protein